MQYTDISNTNIKLKYVRMSGLKSTDIFHYTYFIH